MSVAIPDIYDLRTNFKWIRRILHYWFTSDDNDDADGHLLSATSDDCHRNDLATLQKKLWMISQQNDSLRRDIDRYIIQHFGVLLCQSTQQQQRRRRQIRLAPPRRHQQQHQPVSTILSRHYYGINGALKTRMFMAGRAN